jgi:arabinofuranosyltransferase
MSDGAERAVESESTLGQRMLPGLALIVFIYALIATAWICDDAFITFRTLRNLFAGDGLTWNPGARVQAYTHPAWLLLTTLPFSLSGECYFSILALSLLLSCGCAALLLDRLRGQPLLAAGALLLLSASLAFVEYAVCGLENPLLFLLLLVFCRLYAWAGPRGRELVRPGLALSALALTRLDALLLVAPATVELWWRRPDRARAAVELCVGGLPLLGWELFSLVYYGSFVPNTAIAKLNLDVPADQLFGHGAAYFSNSLRSDPLTLLATLGCALALTRSRQPRANAIVLGLLAYVVYLVRIGGDFMSGRFCGALLVLALASFVEFELPARWSARAQLGLLAVVTVYALAWPRSPWRLRPDYGAGLRVDQLVHADGIADERAYYYPECGLIPVLRARTKIAESKLPLPPYPTALHGRKFAQREEKLASTKMIGFYGYFAGRKHVIDRFALGDPFLARIPFRTREGFRPGHYLRELPEGYRDSIAQGRNLLRDPELAKLYDRVQLAVSGPLFSAARWRAIACLNWGRCG